MLVRKIAPVANLGKKILVVDDDPQILKLLHAFLEGKGYVVSTSQNGWDCLKDVLSIDPDLLILDIKMPKMDGMAVLNMLKNGGFTKEVPVILITGLKQQDTVVTAGQLKTDEYIVKPFDLDDLAHRVAAHLYSIDVTSVRERLSHMENPDKRFFAKTHLANESWKQWKAFPITMDDIELCFLVSPKSDPRKLSQQSDEEIANNAVVLVRLTTNWKQIFPVG